MDNLVDRHYQNVLGHLLHRGVRREGRNGATFGLFGEQLRFDLAKGFPLLTTKWLYFHGIKVELLWFLRGDSNIKFLHGYNVHIWDQWADKNGDLGPVYGKQWRHWQNYPGDPSKRLSSIDQIAGVIKSLKENPFSRRHIVTAWNPAEVDDMALPPCHCLFQFNVRPGKHEAVDDEFDVLYLDCQLYQRSADWFIGVPFNIASYALLVHLIAREVSMVPGEFIHTFGDYHLYENHLDAAREQLNRKPLRLPELKVNEQAGSIFDLKPEDITVDGYDPHPAIKAEVSK